MPACSQHCSLLSFALLLNHISRYCAPGPVTEPPAAPPTPVLIQEHSQEGDTVRLLCRAPHGYGGVLFRLYRNKTLMDSKEFDHETPEAHFSVSRDSVSPHSFFCCLYQSHQNMYSAFSLYMKPAELLPAPTLSLVKQDPLDEVATVLECVGSAAYPGALFSLFHVGSSEPTTFHWAPPTRYHTRFSTPTQLHPAYLYQCQFRVRVGADWRESERSSPLGLPGPTGTSSDVSPENGGVTDWPLIVGSLSAVLLFIAVLGGLGFAVRWRVKALVEKRRKREAERLWAHVHAKDHTLDLTPRRISIGFQDWPSVTEDRGSGTARTPQYPLSTFTSPAAH